MSIGTTVTAQEFTLVSAGVACNCNWPIDAEANVEVRYGVAGNLAVLGTDYTVDISDGGITPTYYFTVTPTTSLINKINALIAADAEEENRIIVRRNMPLITPLTQADAFFRAQIEAQVTQIHMKLQQLDETIGRAILLPPNIIGDKSAVLPVASDRASRAVAFDADGALTVTPLGDLPPALGEGVLTTPEAYLAVGNGVADDTTARDAAANAAGTTGAVWYKGTYKVSSRLDRPQARGYGPGSLTDGTLTWRADAGRAGRRRREGLRTRDAVKVSNGTGYHHLPSYVDNLDGDLLLTYYSGRNHGQADIVGVAMPQQLVGPATDMTLNGNEAANLGNMGSYGSRITIHSTADESGKTITIFGTDSTGAVTSETLTGPAAGASVTTTKRWRAATLLRWSVTPAGFVRAGLTWVPSAIVLGLSRDGGTTWSYINLFGDGGWDDRYYENVIVRGATGRITALAQRLQRDDGVVTWKRRYSDDGGYTWSTMHDPVFNFTWRGSLYIYGEPTVMPSGRIYFAAYDTGSGGTLADIFPIYSDDDGLTWNAEAKVASPGPGEYTEPALFVVDERTRILWTRVQNITSALHGYRSLNGGFSFAAFAPLDSNQTVLGVYASPHPVGWFDRDGELHYAIALAVRNSQTGTTEFPFSMCFFCVSASDLAASSQRFTKMRPHVTWTPAIWTTATAYAVGDYVKNPTTEETYRCARAHTSGASTEPDVGASWADYWDNNYPVRSGYASFVIDPTNGNGSYVYAHETKDRASEIRIVRVNLNDFAGKGLDKFDTTNLDVVGSGGTANVYGTRTCYTSKEGKYAEVDYSITINTRNVTGSLKIGPLKYRPKIAGGKFPVELSGSSAGVLAVYARTLAGDTYAELRHDTTAGTAPSAVDATELGAAPITLSGRLRYLTDD
jgi:hypothetical protein